MGLAAFSSRIEFIQQIEKFYKLITTKSVECVCRKKLQCRMLDTYDADDFVASIYLLPAIRRKKPLWK
ncbi:hypothetical protein F2P81_004911 [Scophthalmus maximus]|uniref:Uncharacterized protein n=1 Tax=Scophthalmus maximus TaxID=52904 RepID=A0A6A4TK29_SCOMX|nr:hypothetical protein F2P81_004911 [Scophthalmus maximus]